MKTDPILTRTVTLLVFFMLTISSFRLFSQTSFTVVCDKADNKVKVVESSNRSPGFVPIRGGFPFRQVAQQWVKDNYPSGTCDPEEVKRGQQPPSAPSAPAGPPQPPANSPPRVAQTGLPPVAPLPPKEKFRNNTLLFQAIMANMGGAFSLGKIWVPGLGVGYDRLFGKQLYFGTGLNVSLFFVGFDGSYGYGQQTFLMPRIPLYLGYRKKGPKYTVMAEAGIHANAAMIASDPDWEIPGKTTSSQNFDLLLRMRIGNERLMLEFGTEYWLSGLFDNDDFRMSSNFIGGRFFF